MTTMSTILAIGMMPFNLWLYSRSWLEAAGGTVIPYVNIVVSLVSIIGPAFVGILIKRWSERAARIVILVLWRCVSRCGASEPTKTKAGSRWMVAYIIV